MSATILILTSKNAKATDNNWSERKVAVEQFCQKLQVELPDHIVYYTTYDDLEFSISSDGREVRDLRNDVLLSSMSLVHFKNWQYDQQVASVLAHFLNSQGIPFYNHEAESTAATGKLAQMMRLSLNSLPIPATAAVSVSRLKDYVASNKLPGRFSYPIIFKADDGAQGNDNFLVRSREEFSELLEQIDETELFVLQEFIENDGDFRYLFIGLEDNPLVFHRKGLEGSHLNNTSKGGEGVFAHPGTLEARHMEIARRAATVLEKEIGGVDIIVDKNSGQPYVLEVNGTPAIATGFGRDEKIQAFVNFIESQTEQSEEEE